jgi:hypothetical protein
LNYHFLHSGGTRIWLLSLPQRQTPEQAEV